MSKFLAAIFFGILTFIFGSLITLVFVSESVLDENDKNKLNEKLHKITHSAARKLKLS